MALPELAGWKTESLRVSFIANEPVTAAGKNWWQAATGSPPEMVATKPNTSEHSESGVFRDGRLEMRVSFNRVDWLYTPIMSPGSTEPFLGLAADTLGSLHDLLNNWLGIDKTPYVRIAFGPTMLYPVGDIVEGNRVIMAYLPFIQADPEKLFDAFFQVNYKGRSIIVNDLVINRLNKFMSVAVQVLNIVGQSIPIIQTSYYCRTELDFSTDAERVQPIPSEQRFDLVGELAAACREMISNGVRP